MRPALLIALSAGLALASPCNPASVGSPNPSDEDFNPYHPDFDWDNDGEPNATDTDKDGDGIDDCEDDWLYTRPSENPNWEGPIPIWDNPAGVTTGISDPNLPPFNWDGDADGDGEPNATDLDDDNDGVNDFNDPDHPSYDPNDPASDPDCDGEPNSTDTDDDNDGWPDTCDPSPGCENPPPTIDPPCDPDDPTQPNPGTDPPDPPDRPDPPDPPDRPDPPPPNPRPDPDPPEDDPPPPPPPPTPPDPPTPPVINPPSDDSCCAAICERLDALIVRTYDINVDTTAILDRLNTFIGDGDHQGQFQYFVDRMLTDPDSFRNRVDDGLWTIADVLDLIHYELQYTNSLLTADHSNPSTLPDAPSDLTDPDEALDNFEDTFRSNLSEYGLDNLLPDISAYADPEAGPPVWEISVPWARLPGTPDHGPFNLTIDWSFFAPIRTPFHGMLIFMASLGGLRLVWEELRRYG